MEKNPKVVTISDRLRAAWKAFKGNKVGSLHFGLELKRCDQCDKVNNPDILYLCDGKQCPDGCSNSWCKHTTDINHAINFKRYEGDRGSYFVELERENEED